MTEHHAAISNLEHRFIELLDRRDYREVAKLFAHGSLSISRPNDPNPVSATGEEAVAAMLTGMLPPPSPDSFGRHIASNLIVDVDPGGEKAKARMYTALHLIASGQPPRFVGLGRHMDELAFVDGAWRFSQKSIIGDAQFPPPAA